MLKPGLIISAFWVIVLTALMATVGVLVEPCRPIGSAGLQACRGAQSSPEGLRYSETNLLRRRITEISPHAHSPLMHGTPPAGIVRI
jgi:hypothetical protein